MKRKIYALILLFSISANSIILAEETINNAFHPKYYEIFINSDKYEKFNRKIFNFNMRLNKIIVRNIHIVWDSVFPKFLIDSINRAYYNLEYPKRLVSCIFQRDFDGIKNETKRFLINSTLGVAGIIDVAYKLFKLENYDEDMEQALAKCKIKQGNYLVLPFISSTNLRDIIGRIFDFLLTPSTYFTAPIAAAIKAALLINKTEYIQPIIKMVESNFVDPYDIARKFFGVQKQIKLSNYDRKKVLDSIDEKYNEEVELVDKNKKEYLEVRGKINPLKPITTKISSNDLKADIILSDYNPQTPILDSMRTVLFDSDDINKSMWAIFSLWNRSFIKKIKSASVKIVKERPSYTFRYLLQKDKSSPLAIIFPSIGEGVNSSHNNMLAKIFYDKGYSIIIFGNYFQWEFIRSLNNGYIAGDIQEDIKYVDILVNNAINYLSKKYDRIFIKRTAIGTSLGAYTVLFLADNQFKKGAKNIDNFIAISPPFELNYAIEKIDNIMSVWKKYPEDLKDKLALTTGKAMKYLNSNETDKISRLPFSNFEAKLISGYIFHQKLSDVVFQTEKSLNPNTSEKEIYEKIYNINFSNYIKDYVAKNKTCDEILNFNSLNTISDYLISQNNYRIFESLDDYLISNEQLRELKLYSDDKLTLLSNGSHLGYLYRDEFKQALNDEIEKILQNKK